MKNFMNKLEKATGIDLDGDGTVGGRQQADGNRNQYGYQQQGYSQGQPYVNHSGYQNQPPALANGSQLPPGWEARFDPSSGRQYYIDHKTQKTQWEPPASIPAAAPAQNKPRFCTQCGSKFDSSARFCSSCGAPAEGGGGGNSSSAGVQHNDVPTAVCIAQTWTPSNYSNFQYQPFQPQMGYVPAAIVPGETNYTSGKKKALLVGCNYRGTSAELRGCINDVHAVRDLLRSEGFRSQDMVILTDDQRGEMCPTRMNIMRGLQWLVAGAQAGDVLFFHFSGHGSQQPDQSGYLLDEVKPSFFVVSCSEVIVLPGMEADGANETICPTDFQRAGQIVDDELWSNLVYPLPSGCRLTAIMDCCHSGTGLDLAFTWDQRRGQWYEDENPSHAAADVQMFSGCQDDQCSSDGDVMLFKTGGAMTNAFIRAYTAEKFQTYPDFMQRLKHELRSRGFTQKPQLTSSQPFSVRDKVFCLSDGIVNNMNPQIGRLQRRKIRPQREFFGDMGLGAGGMMEAALMAGMGAMMLNAIFD